MILLVDCCVLLRYVYYSELFLFWTFTQNIPNAYSICVFEHPSAVVCIVYRLMVSIFLSKQDQFLKDYKGFNSIISIAFDNYDSKSC